MGGRYWIWLAARLAVAAAIVLWAASYLIPGGSGEKEFQRTVEALKHVHSFRVASTANSFGVQHNEMMWEIDCERDLAHQQMHLKQDASSISTAQESNTEQIYAAGFEYTRQADGSWSTGKPSYIGDPGKMYCKKLSAGGEAYLFPPFLTMIQRGVIQKGDKKTVNGVRCREWMVTIKGGTRRLEHDTICIGLDDHLPYEMTVDGQDSHETFSDYNTSIQFDLPEAALQQASATAGSN